MYKYELCVVLSAKIEDELRKSELEKIKGYITRFNGSIIEPIEEWGKKKLAYEVNHMNEGYYYFIQFESDSNAPHEIESFIRIMENVMRFLIVKV